MFKKVNTALLGLALSLGMTTAQAEEAKKVDVLLIGGGIMSATLGVWLNELEPGTSMEMIERLDGVAQESSNGWNNAGTGHSALAELNYTPEDENGKASWKVDPLTGELRSGDLIVVRLRLTGPRAKYLMIEDPIPAGAEQVARVSGLYLNYSLGQWCDWYSNREFRDNRTALFMDYFNGDATLQYAMRVEVPGEFKVAPARAELMYQPIVQANTANDRLRILDKK